MKREEEEEDSFLFWEVTCLGHGSIDTICAQTNFLFHRLLLLLLRQDERLLLTFVSFDRLPVHTRMLVLLLVAHIDLNVELHYLEDQTFVKFKI